MRISVRTSNRRQRKKCKYLRVTLNEEDVTLRCRALDTREGWAELFEKDAAGRYVIHPNKEEVVVRRHHGRVRAWSVR